MLLDQNESIWDLTVIRTSKTCCESYSVIEMLLKDIESIHLLVFVFLNLVFKITCIQTHMKTTKKFVVKSKIVLANRILAINHL